MVTDLTLKTNDELEDTLMDLCGRLILNTREMELLCAVEEEREKRFKEVGNNGKGGGATDKVPEMRKGESL